MRPTEIVVKVNQSDRLDPCHALAHGAIGTSLGQLSAASVEVIRFNFFRVPYTLRIKRLSFNGINAPP